ncbi:hypothetical protein [Mobiluncus curtisii]|uniref:hypothetical protein n=1 Tax=Mobiluncus curtisii TaxID=2051 RepID=UPI000569126E|nr:hypothetical protein [Mobiluncus curtisii]
MSAVLSNGIDYLDKVSHQQAHILGAFMAVAYWEYVLEFNPELAKRPEMRALTNQWRKNRLYLAVEDFLAFDMQKFFARIVEVCPEYATELGKFLERTNDCVRDIWEIAYDDDVNMPELIFPNLEPTIKE